MRKYFIIAIILMLTTKNLISQTNVSGGIYTNTTWTTINSPYHVIGDVVVFPNITLTIEPGVTILFDNSKKLEIRGNLQAVGSINDSIIFNSSSPNPVMGIWSGIDFGGTQPGTGAFNYCVLKFANNAIDLEGSWGGSGPITVSNSSFRNNSRGVYGYGSFTFQIDKCTFLNNEYGLHGTNFNVTNSSFKDNTTKGIDGGGSNVTSSSFCGNQTGVHISGNLQNCIVQYNDLGVEYGSTPSNNIITYNNTGIKVFSGFGINNTICENINYNIKNVNSNPIDASNNCWCSSDSIAIAQKVYDGYDNVSLGLINFSPYTNCNNSAIPLLTNCQNPVSVKEKTSVDVYIKLFPNPTSNQLTIDTELKLSEINIIDITGKTIKTITTDFNTVDVSNLTNGIYFIKIINKEGSITKKFVKQ